MSQPPSRTPPSGLDLILSFALWVCAFGGAIATGILLLAVSAPRGVKFVAVVVVVMLTVLCAGVGQLFEAKGPPGE